MSNPKYSIILPVHNGIRHIALCVQSILAQTFGNFNLEILENKSTDGTAEWLSSLKDPRIRVWPSEKFLPIEENWKRILTIPANEYMTIVSHDDIFYPDFLEVIDGLIQAHPDAQLYQTHFDYIDAEGNSIRKCWPIPVKESKESFLIARMTVSRDSCATGYVMRSLDYRNCGGIPLFPKLLYADDALWIKLMHSSYKITSEKYCFGYRAHLESTSVSAKVADYAIPLWKYLLFLKSYKSAYINTILEHNWKNYVAYFLEEEDICSKWLMNGIKEPDFVKRTLALILPGFLYILIRKIYLLIKKFILKVQGKDYTGF